MQMQFLRLKSYHSWRVVEIRRFESLGYRRLTGDLSVR